MEPLDFVGEGRIMSLESWLNLNYNAAITLYVTRRMHLLTDDEYYLSGEATAMEATVLLLQRQLSLKNAEGMTRSGRQRRALKSGPNRATRKSSRYRGVQWTGRGKAWRATVRLDSATEGSRKHCIGNFATEEEAARAWDAYVEAHGLRRKTNRQLGLLEEG